MKKYFFLLALQVLAALAATAQGIRFEQEDRPFSEILAQAARERKMVFVAAYSKTCHTCEHMISKIYPNDSLAETFDSETFINVKMDVDAEQNLEFATQNQIFGYPTYLFFDENGQALHRAAGGKSVEKMLELGKIARDPAQHFYKLLEKFEAGDRDPVLLARLAAQAKDLHDYSLSEKVLPAYLETQTDWTTRENLELILAAVFNIEQPIFKFLVEKKAVFIATLADEARVKNKIDEVALNSLSMVSYDHELRQFDLVKAKNYGLQFLPDELVAKTTSIFQLNQLIRRNDMANFYPAAVAHFERFECHNPHIFNNFAVRIFQTSDDPQLLAKAADWAVRAAQLDDSFQSNDLAAAIFHKAKNPAQAKIFAQKAIEIARKTGENDTDTQKILLEIESAGK